MANKILEIREKVAVNCTLPDGLYYGTWGAYTIEVLYKGKTYTLRTEEGVRGIGYNVVAQIKGDEMTFEVLKN